ncbi:MAG: proton-conducting transporter membrane subunit [Thermofilum sp.]
MSWFPALAISLAAPALLAPLLSGKPRLVKALTLLGAASALAIHALSPASSSGELSLDSFSYAVLLIALLDALVALAGFTGPASEYAQAAPFYSIALLSALGVAGLAYAGTLPVLLASWALFSVASFALFALAKDKFSAAGAVKYGLMSVASSSFLLLALSAATAATGSLAIEPSRAGGHLLLASLGLLLAAVGFKVGVFPFHAWLPDAYGVSDPLPVSLVSALSKSAAVLVFYKLSLVAADTLGDSWLRLVGLAALLTMTYGNIAALLQRSLQGLLAYSSIAHAGYILVGVAALSLHGQAKSLAVAGLLLQLLAYSFGKTGLFLAARLLRRSGAAPVSLEEVKGLGAADPGAAASSLILLLSLMGMPPLAGFWGKLYLFLSVVESAPWLTAIALINTGIGAAYYARLVKSMYFESGKPATLPYRSTRAALLACSAVSVAAGFLLPFVLL